MRNPGGSGCGLSAIGPEPYPCDTRMAAAGFGRRAPATAIRAMAVRTMSRRDMMISSHMSALDRAQLSQ